MNIEDLLRVGDDILNEVAEAINTNNYEDLGRKISSRIRDARDELYQQTNYRTGRDAYRQKPGTSGSSTARPGAGGGYNRPAGQPGSTNRPVYTQPAQQVNGTWTAPAARPSYGNRSHFMLRRVSKAGSTIRKILGGVGVFLFGVPSLIMATALASGGIEFGAGMAGLIVFGALTAVCGVMLHKGVKSGRLADRYYEYGRRLGGTEYFSIRELAEQTGMREEDVRRDLLEMIRSGYLPQARLDTQQKTVMLTDQAYQLYLQAEAGRQQRETAERASRRQNAGNPPQTAVQAQKRPADSEERKEIREILERGNAYIRKVREVNDQIPDTEEMSTKLYRLEEIMHRIFEQVQKQPESAAGLRRFMDYYLPTTEKLLDAYVELDRQPVSGENVVKTKKEIDEALDVINDAFENLLNNMFENMAWDISSDISAMKTMMIQDGLTENGNLSRRTVQDYLKGAEKEKVKEPV